MNNILEYKGYNGTVEYSAEDNILFGRVIGIKSLISYEGQSVEELKADFEGAVDDYLEYCRQNNIEPEKKYKGSLKKYRSFSIERLRYSWTVWAKELWNFARIDYESIFKKIFKS